ncbi:MAG TPA: hypothetical protein DCM28_17470 [Phycisphaerales bacterium]|nr:hypothetical protein [Phycisphaerales bacterium]HCD34478.1 hypothetical protein [Phycisphaerales bacterium]|tara:strand:- start:87124 stop:87792 length:669 start_codon:yes stop_codon:yes gene_type:complete
MKLIVLLLTMGLATSFLHAADKTFVLPIDAASSGYVSDLDQDGKYEKVSEGMDNAMEWRVGQYFTGPVVIVMEVALPAELQGQTVKVQSAALSVSANGVHGTYPEKTPETVPDCLIYTYTGKQADGKVTAEDVLDAQGNFVGREAGLLIENQTPLKAGTRITADITDAIQKAVDEKAPIVGLRLQLKTLPSTLNCWRWRGPAFAAKYGKQYAPVLTLKVTAE